MEGKPLRWKRFPLPGGTSPLKTLKEAGKRLSKRGCLNTPAQAAPDVGFRHGNIPSTNGRFLIGHNNKTHLTRARNRSAAAGAVRTVTYNEGSIRLHRHSRSAKPNWSNANAGKRQQPGFRGSGGYGAHSTFLVFVSDRLFTLR